MFLIIHRFLRTKFLRFILLFTIVIYLFYLVFHDHKQQELQILTWSEFFPLPLLKEFEKKNNIKLIIDYFDSQEVLETKLNSGFSGYDLITPTATPVLVRYIQQNLLLPITKEKIKDYKNIFPIFWEKMKTIDPTNKYLVPFGYGTFGILYNQTRIKCLGLSVQPESYEYFFNPRLVKQFSQYGIGLLNDWQDVFGAALCYLGYLPQTQNRQALYQAYNTLHNIRPYIRRFSNNRYINDVLVDELLYTQALSDEAARAIIDAKENGIELVFVRPAEEKRMYIDCFAIPRTSQASELAHKFIDFCLEEENAIAITRHSKIPNTVSHRFQKQLDPAYFLNTPIDQLIVLPLRPKSVNSELLRYWQHFLQKLPLINY